MLIITPQVTTQWLCRHEFESPKSIFFLFQIFRSTLLTPSRLKPATLRAWGVGTGFWLSRSNTYVRNRVNLHVFGRELSTDLWFLLLSQLWLTSERVWKVESRQGQTSGTAPRLANFRGTKGTTYNVSLFISENEQFGSLANFQFTINFHWCLFASLTVMLVAEQLNVKVRCLWKLIT